MSRAYPVHFFDVDGVPCRISRGGAVVTMPRTIPGIRACWIAREDSRHLPPGKTPLIIGAALTLDALRAGFASDDIDDESAR